MGADYSRVTHPCAALLRAEAPFTLDLHVLGLPPAFVLSQDQTLQFDLYLKDVLANVLSFLYCRCFRICEVSVTQSLFFRLALLLVSLSSSVFKSVANSVLSPSTRSGLYAHPELLSNYFFKKNSRAIFRQSAVVCTTSVLR